MTFHDEWMILGYCDLGTLRNPAGKVKVSNPPAVLLMDGRVALCREDMGEI